MSTDTPSLYEQQAVELKTMALQDMSQRAKNAMNAAADDVRELERENARLREELELIRAALTGDDYASLPSDLPTVRMAHTIRADHDKFRNQVRDTCHRAEQAEARALAAEKDAAIAKFGAMCFAEHRAEMSDLDGGWLQERALECGLIYGKEVTAEMWDGCGSVHCECEVGDVCYFPTDAGKAAIDAASAGAKHE